MSVQSPTSRAAAARTPGGGNKKWKSIANGSAFRLIAAAAASPVISGIVSASGFLIDGEASGNLTFDGIGSASAFLPVGESTASVVISAEAAGSAALITGDAESAIVITADADGAAFLPVGIADGNFGEAEEVPEEETVEASGHQFIGLSDVAPIWIPDRIAIGAVARSRMPRVTGKARLKVVKRGGGISTMPEFRGIAAAHVDDFEELLFLIEAA